jgi:hypothetical protein
MALNDFANRILNAVQGDKEAIKKISEALVSGDVARIRQVLADVAKIEVTEAEVQEMLATLRSEPEQAAAYNT